MTTQIPWTGADSVPAMQSTLGDTLGVRHAPDIHGAYNALIRPKDDAGMIFLRHNESGWYARFVGVKGIGNKNVELPLPQLSDASLTHVTTSVRAKWPTCWLYVVIEPVS